MVIFNRLAEALRTDRPVALVTRLDGPHAGAKLLVFEDEHAGDLGSAGLNNAAVREARALLAVGQNALRSFGEDGEPVGTDVRLFIAAYAPKPAMYVFGAIDFSRAMARIGKYLGYRVTVVDARPVFATKARIPDADEIVVSWPDEFLAGAPVDARTALVILTHDVKFDIPLLRVALRTDAGFIGAMGSRRTHAARVEALRAAGVTGDELARICAPIGLDIGGDTPEEMAIAVAAEIVAVRSGRSGGRLRDGSNAIHSASGGIVFCVILAAGASARMGKQKVAL
ncbi:MAG: XdhC family protein, partial [Candidatus Eremiobacteraeota bacterium]|nr:XdhC family protein [Candidatus Eremiobacteraeota bacterium]